MDLANLKIKIEEIMYLNVAPGKYCVNSLALDLPFSPFLMTTHPTSICTVYSYSFSITFAVMCNMFLHCITNQIIFLHL